MCTTNPNRKSVLRETVFVAISDFATLNQYVVCLENFFEKDDIGRIEVMLPAIAPTSSGPS